MDQEELFYEDVNVIFLVLERRGVFVAVGTFVSSRCPGTEPLTSNDRGYIHANTITQIHFLQLHEFTFWYNMLSVPFP
jgi:hypothetical protein